MLYDTSIHFKGREENHYEAIVKRLFIAGLVLILLVLGVGGYIGNTAFQEFRQLPWDHVLGIENHSHDVDSIKNLKKE